jgi:hypothetical protein
MKVQNGFVSNCSSNSFVTAIGKIKPEELYFFEEHINLGYQVRSVEEAVKEDETKFFYFETDKSFAIEYPGVYNLWLNVELSDKIASVIVNCVDVSAQEWKKAHVAYRFLLGVCRTEIV